MRKKSLMSMMTGSGLQGASLLGNETGDGPSPGRLQGSQGLTAKAMLVYHRHKEDGVHHQLKWRWGGACLHH